MHLQRVTVWCDFWSGGIIGPFFFENEQGVAVTVNGERYRAMLNEFLLPKFEEEDTDNIWFQQRTLTHNQCYNRSFAHCFFENRIISRNADINWLPRNCDLTPLDYFLWGTIKDDYANQPETIQELKHEIKVVIDEIRAHTVKNVLKN